MEINYIKEFLTLAENCNFLETADTHFISQSTLSRHLQILESSLGTPLFRRTTRRVELNKHGRAFLPYARQLVSIQDQCETTISNMVKKDKAKLTIGSIATMAQYNITSFLTKFQHTNPTIHIEIIEGDTGILKDMIRSQKCDFAFVRENPGTDCEFERIPYTTDSLIAILPSTHTLANSKTISLDQLQNETFHLLHKDSLMYDLCINSCRNSGFEPQIGITGHRGDTLADLVKNGAGVSLLMKKPSLPMSNRNISLVDIVPSINTDINIIYNKTDDFSYANNCFLNYIKTLL